jgi:acetolactate synthase-1/2/3 large subunit
VTGIATAMLDNVPMVCITGQVPGALIGSDAFQETDITGVTLPITKHNFLVRRAEDIPRVIREAFYIASSGRPGPVVVDITKDAQQASCPFEWSDEPIELPGYRPEQIVREDDLAEAVRLLERAERPLILAGQGVIRARATEHLLALVGKQDIPVACTLLGLGGFPATHPMALGMAGMHGEAWVNKAIQEADVILALGMRFDDRITGNPKTFAAKAKKIHVELDPAEIDKIVKVEVGLVGDVRDVLGVLIPRLSEKRRPAWTARIDEMKGDSAVRDIQSLPDEGRLYAAHVIHDLWRLTEGRALVVTDVGQHQMWEAQYYKHDYPRRLLTSGGLGTMGFALPAAIGARFALNVMSAPSGKPDPTEVWVVAGDGGFQMTACELSTIAQEGIKIHVAIINNGYLGMVRQWQELFYGGRYVATPMKSPDFVKLAEAHGLKGLRATTRSEVEKVVREAQASTETTVIDFRVEQEDSVYPMVASGKDLDDMIRRPERQKKHNPIYETGED